MGDVSYWMIDEDPDEPRRNMPVIVLEGGRWRAVGTVCVPMGALPQRGDLVKVGVHALEIERIIWREESATPLLMIDLATWRSLTGGEDG